MARDDGIQSIFTRADDALQGLWGLHTYIGAAIAVACEDRLHERLPKGSFRLTHEWNRYYEPAALLCEMQAVGESVICRTSLIHLVALFEATVKQFYQRLSDLNRIELSKRVKDNHYVTYLKWAFEILRVNPVASLVAKGRLPETCGDVDNARRLRNLIVHNNSRYNDGYRNAIRDEWVKVQYEEDFDAAISGGKSVQLNTKRFEYFSQSHIELLHILHNTIQKRFFSHDAGFDYGEEGKGIEWHRVLTG